MKATHDFTDAWEMNRKYPETFEIPDDEDIDELGPGDFAKVCLGNERFWVQLNEVDMGNGTFTGTVDNDLYSVEDLKYGDTVTFERRHIYDTIKADESVH